MNAGSQLIGALEGLWACIQDRHPDVPDVLFITGSGDGDAKRGHFAARRWQEAGSTATLHELFVAGEQLAEGAAPVLQTTLHEAAHALATARKVKDTSRQGRYHNRRFVALAEELGLCHGHDTPHAGFGFAFVSLTPETLAAYDVELKALAAAIRHHYAASSSDDEDGDETPARPPRPRYECGCPRVVRMSQATHDEGPIVCGLCDEPFDPVVD